MMTKTPSVSTCIMHMTRSKLGFRTKFTVCRPSPTACDWSRKRSKTEQSRTEPHESAMNESTLRNSWSS